jgi:hypothetical protein
MTERIVKYLRINQIISLALLLVLLPIHTPLTTYLINVQEFPVFIVFWKEFFTLLLLASFGVEICISLFKSRFKTVTSLWPVAIFAFMFTWILGLSLVNNISITSIVYGIRFELWWVLVLAVGLTWRHLKISIDLDKKLFQFSTISIYIGVIISTLFALGIFVTNQTDQLMNLGYGQYQGESAYLNPVLCHPIDAFSDQCRLSGGFTLPNHYAGYLLLVIGFLLFRLYSTNTSNKEKWLAGILSLSSAILIFLSSSRFAILGLAILLGWIVLRYSIVFTDRISLRLPNWLVKSGVITLVLAPMAVGIVGINLPPSALDSLPLFLGKPSSTLEHYRRTMANVDIIRDNPTQALIGYGAGTSGPAAKPEYVNVTENPLHEPYIDIANHKWLIGIGIFVPENWYIQLLLNGGLIYTILYIFLIGYVVWKMLYVVLRADNHLELKKRVYTPRYFMYLGLLGIIVGNLFLHIWENQTLAIYYALLPILLNSVEFDHIG